MNSYFLPGIKRNLQRTYASWSYTKLSSADQGRALFILAWFHALVQERRTYIPQGWAKFYEFNDSDLNAALNVLNARLSQGRTLTLLLTMALKGPEIYCIKIGTDFGN